MLARGVSVLISCLAIGFLFNPSLPFPPSEDGRGVEKEQLPLVHQRPTFQSKSQDYLISEEDIKLQNHQGAERHTVTEDFNIHQAVAGEMLKNSADQLSEPYQPQSLGVYGDINEPQIADLEFNSSVTSLSYLKPLTDLGIKEPADTIVHELESESLTKKSNDQESLDINPKEEFNHETISESAQKKPLLLASDPISLDSTLSLPYILANLFPGLPFFSGVLIELVLMLAFYAWSSIDVKRKRDAQRKENETLNAELRARLSELSEMIETEKSMIYDMELEVDHEVQKKEKTETTLRVLGADIEQQKNQVRKIVEQTEKDKISINDSVKSQEILIKRIGDKLKEEYQAEAHIKTNLQFIQNEKQANTQLKELTDQTSKVQKRLNDRIEQLSSELEKSEIRYEEERRSSMMLRKEVERYQQRIQELEGESSDKRSKSRINNRDGNDEHLNDEHNDDLG